MSGTFLVYSILLSLPSTVSSTAKSHVLNVVRDIGHVKSTKKTSRIATLTTAYHNLVKKISTDVIHCNVRYLPGLLLLVVLAVHSAVEHETT